MSRVAREFNVNANQVFTWRKQFGEGQCEITSTDAYQLLPVTVTQPGRVPASSVVVKDKAQSAGVIELSVGQAQLRLEGSVDAATLGLVLARLLP